MDEGAGVAAVVHGVVEQAGMPAQGNAQPGGAEIGFGGDGILLPGYLVADMGQHLDQHDGLVRRAALGPPRHQRGEPVQHEAAEAVIILGEIVNRRVRPHLGRADMAGATVEVGGAAGLERERDDGQFRIEAVRRVGGGIGGRARQHQFVERIVVDLAVGHRHRQHSAGLLDGLHLRVAEPHAAADQDIPFGEFDAFRIAAAAAREVEQEGRLDFRQGWRKLQIDLDEVDTVQSLCRQQCGSPAILGAAERVVHGTVRVNEAMPVLPLSRSR